MKKLLLLLHFAFTITANAQSFNEDKTTFSNFIKRMYTATPFEGVKIVDDYEHQYLISVISLEKAKYNDPSIMNRIAQVKAQSQANTFLNGASISMDMIIKTTEKVSKDSTSSITETVESIKQNSAGFTQGLELLTNFDNNDNKRTIFIYVRELKKQI
jgi:hypothetical protein